MSSPDDSIAGAARGQPISRASTGEISMLPPEEASKVIDEIRAVAESRGEDSRGRRAGRAADRPSARSIPADPTAAPAARGEPTTSSAVDELRDAWPLLDLDERSDGLRVLPREDAEDFFIALIAERPGGAAASTSAPASAASGCACSSPTTSPT